MFYTKRFVWMMVCLCCFVFVLLVSVGSVFAQTKLDPKVYDKNGFKIIQGMPDASSLSSSASSSAESPFDETETVTGSFKQGESASCFDYYTIGNVAVKISTDTSSYMPGNPVSLRGQIINNNKYPLTNLTVKARLVKNIPNPDYLRAEIITIDDFNIVENVTLNAGESFDINYSKALPLNASNGKYQVFFYAYTNNRFNQSGLSYTNDVVASRLSFNVESSNPQYVYLDQTRIVLNGKKHNVMAFMTNHQKDDVIEVSIPVVNPSVQDEEMTIVYKLYKWDGINDKNVVDTKTENIIVPKQSEVKLTYVAPKTDASVYFLNIVADSQNGEKDKSVYDIKTESNIRFAVFGHDFPKIDTFGVNTYPIKADQEVVLFTCYQNGSSQTTLDELNISTALFDEKGGVVAQTEYIGKINGDVRGIIKKFTSKKDLVNFKIVTTIKDSKGGIIDEIENEYNCKDIDPTLCPVKSSYAGMWALIGLIILIGVVMLIIKMKNKTKIPTVMFSFVLLAVSLFGFGNNVEAAQMSYSFNIPIGRGCDLNLPYLCSWRFAGGIWGTIHKNFNFISDSSDLSLDQNATAVINIGDKIDIKNEKTTGEWVVSGGFNDTPPADGSYWVLENIDSGGIKMWAGAVSYPYETSPIITSSNPDVVSCTNSGCEAVSSGTANITVSFPNKEHSTGNIFYNGSNGYGFVNINVLTFSGDLPRSLGKTGSKYPTYWDDMVGKNVNHGMFNNQYRGYSWDNFMKRPYFTMLKDVKMIWGSTKSISYAFPDIVYKVNVPASGNVDQSSSICTTTTNESRSGAQVNWTYNDPDNMADPLVDKQTGYHVQVALNANFTSGSIVQSLFAPSNTDVADVRSQTIVGLNPNTKYYYRVKTQNSTNGWNENFSLCTSVPAVVANKREVTDTSAVVWWNYNDSSPQTNYQVKLSEQPDFSNPQNIYGQTVSLNIKKDNFLVRIIKKFFGSDTVVAQTSIANKRDVLFSVLNPNTPYYAQVRASNAVGWGEWSNTSFTTTGSVTPASCGVSVVESGKTLISGPNLCTAGFTSKDFALNLPISSGYPVWKWKCERGTEINSCSARCGDLLTYCEETQTCSASCGGDMCPGSDVPGVQTESDPIYSVANCSIPTLNLSSTFNKPYADEETSKCSVNWLAEARTGSTVIPADYINCTLDGGNVLSSVNNREISVGRHLLSCFVEIKGGTTDIPVVLKSETKTSTLRCSRARSSIED